MEKPKLFVSYSHDDQALVGPIVALLRASHAVVFFDRDTLVPGKKWRDQILQAISDSSTVAVFWCVHSRYSKEVRVEYEEAIRRGKDVLPLLLDDAPLPDVLAEYQFIDLQGAVRAQHDGPTAASPATLSPAASAPSAPPSPAASPHKSTGRSMTVPLGFVVGIGLLAIAALALLGVPLSTLAVVGSGVAFGFVLLTLTYTVLFRRNREPSVHRARTVDHAPRNLPDQYAFELAQRIENEVVRRAAARASEASQETPSK